MSNESAVLNLLAGVEFSDPRLADALSLLTKDLYKAYYQLNPPTGRNAVGITGQLATIPNLAFFTGDTFSNNLRLRWGFSLTEIGIPAGFLLFEIRYHAGVNTDWATGDVILRTSTFSADINPLTIPLTTGSHTFLIKAISSSDTESPAALVFTLTVAATAAPVITPTVIDNNVLLYWSTPASTWQVDYYNVYKDATLLGTMRGTFEAIFETVSGTYVYAVEAVDIVGNIGTRGYVTAVVNQPPDYELQDQQTSALGGTKVNTRLEDSILYGCIDLTTLYNAHFTVPGWASPQDQVNAGYPYFIQPNLLTGSYEEVIDYGTLLSNTIVNLIWSQTILAGSITVVAKIASSVDGAVYSAFTIGSSAFFASLRYVKIRFEFTATNAMGFIAFSNLQITLAVKREIDSGTVFGQAADANGTEVAFNKAFKDIDSITLTVQSTQPVTAMYRFVDIPDPVSFFVYIFDSSGNRVDATVSWKARGIV